MSRILVYIETTGHEPSALSRDLLAGAAALTTGDDEIIALVVNGTDGVQEAAQLDAAILVVADDGMSSQDYTAERHGAALLAAVEKYEPDLVFIPNSYVGIDLAAWLATKTKRPLLGNCISVKLSSSTVTAVAQGYDGKLEVTMECETPAVLSINSGAFGKQTIRSGTPDSVSLTFESANATTVVGRHCADTAQLDISSCEKLISIGRGIGDEDNIELAYELAELLEAEVSASRPLVDQGWIEKSRQVGKSGKSVTPKLYLALGISGAPEHIEGMKDADLIIAANTDPSAPIFEVAHYGTTCDILDLIPELTERLEE